MLSLGEVGGAVSDLDIRRGLYHADEFAAVADSEAELADAAGAPLPDRNRAGNGEILFRDHRLDGFGDGVEFPAEGGAEEIDRFGQADVAEAPGELLCFELRQGEPGADLLLERRTAGRGVLNALDVDMGDLPGEAGEHRRAVVHQKSGVDADRENRHAGRAGGLIDFRRRRFVEWPGVEELLAGGDGGDSGPGEFDQRVGAGVGAGDGGDGGDVGGDSLRRGGNGDAAGGAPGDSSGVGAGEFRGEVDDAGEFEFGTAQQGSVKHPADLAEAAQQDSGFLHR